MAHFSENKFNYIFNKQTFGFAHPSPNSYLSKYIALFSSVACHHCSELVTVFFVWYSKKKNTLTFKPAVLN